MRKEIKALTFMLAFVMMAMAVVGVGEQAVTCSIARPATGSTTGDENDGNTSIAFGVNCDNAAITVSTMVLTLSPPAGSVGSTITLTGQNASNTSYYELSVEEFPDEGYSVYATTTFVNTTNSTDFVDSDDTLNLTSLSSTSGTIYFNVETNEGSLMPEKEAEERKEKDDNTMTFVAIGIIIIIIIAVALSDKKRG